MSVYTVHQPPLRAAGTAADPDRFVFVRDGFSWWAFLLTPLWMLWHQLWLALIVYLVVVAGMDVLLRALGASWAAYAIVDFSISLLVGLEAGTLRRFKLARRRWHNVGVVTGDRLEDAERRFFDGWIRQGAAGRTAPPNAPGASRPASAPRSASAGEASGVIGLFPEPGAHR
jgi:hypothetical protein